MARKSFTTPEVAEYFRVKPSTVQAWARTGQIRYRKIGRCFQFLQKDLDEFEKKRTISPIACLANRRRVI